MSVCVSVCVRMIKLFPSFTVPMQLRLQHGTTPTAHLSSSVPSPSLRGSFQVAEWACVVLAAAATDHPGNRGALCSLRTLRVLAHAAAEAEAEGNDDVRAAAHLAVHAILEGHPGAEELLAAALEGDGAHAGQPTPQSSAPSSQQDAPAMRVTTAGDEGGGDARAVGRSYVPQADGLEPIEAAVDECDVETAARLEAALGISGVADTPLMFLVHELLCAPPLPPWQRCVLPPTCSDTTRVYWYLNPATGQVTAQHPLVEVGLAKHAPVVCLAAALFALAPCRPCACAALRSRGVPSSTRPSRVGPCKCRRPSPW